MSSHNSWNLLWGCFKVFVKLDKEGDWCPTLEVGVQVLLESDRDGSSVVVTHTRGLWYTLQLINLSELGGVYND